MIANVTNQTTYNLLFTSDFSDFITPDIIVLTPVFIPLPNKSNS